MGDKAFAAKIRQQAGGFAENQLVGVKELIINAVFAVFVIYLPVAVLPVADYRMSDACHMCADLVESAGYQVHGYERCVGVRIDRREFGYGQLAAVRGFG